LRPEVKQRIILMKASLIDWVKAGEIKPDYMCSIAVDENIQLVIDWLVKCFEARIPVLELDQKTGPSTTERFVFIGPVGVSPTLVFLNATAPMECCHFAVQAINEHTFQDVCWWLSQNGFTQQEGRNSSNGDCFSWFQNEDLGFTIRLTWYRQAILDPGITQGTSFDPDHRGEVMRTRPDEESDASLSS